jgi:transposase InsO family protein
MEADPKYLFWWPRLAKDVAQFALASETCRQVKATRKAFLGNLGCPIDGADRPFRYWKMDFADAPCGQGYILMLICAFSGYALSRKCNSSTHTHVLDMLWDAVIYVHGVPIRIHSDQGTHFTATAVQEVASRLGIQLTFGPTPHSRAQGMVEKAIGNVKKAYETVLETHEGMALARALLIATWHHNTHMHSRLHSVSRLTKSPMDSEIGAFST